MRIVLLLVLGIALAACTAKSNNQLRFEDLPEGDASRGEALYTTSVAPPCVSCHVAPFTASPDLAGYAERAEMRVVGMSAEEYSFYSIVEPERYIVEGFGNAMYNEYGEELSAQQVADLIAYLLTQ
jgi:cytochrome c553